MVGRAPLVAGVRTSVRRSWTVVRLIVLLSNVCIARLAPVLVMSNRVRSVGRPAVVFVRKRLMLFVSRLSNVRASKLFCLFCC